MASGEFRALAGAPLDRLFTLSDPLLDEGRARLRVQQSFTAAKRFVDTTTVAELLAGIFARDAARRALSPLLVRVHHVGFVVPEDLGVHVEWAARTTGFDLSTRTVPSVVLARELGHRLGRPVPTRIFAATGEGAEGLPVGIEVFIPEVAPGVARAWVAQGVGVHVALELSDVAALPEARRIFESAGFAMPPFMEGRPMTNSQENVTLMYFDGAYDGRRLRVECLASSAGAD